MAEAASLHVYAPVGSGSEPGTGGDADLLTALAEMFDDSSAITGAAGVERAAGPAGAAPWPGTVGPADS